MTRGLVDLASGVPICAFTGINGAGKTLLAVTSAICDMLTGREVWSTVPIKYTAKDGTVYESRPLTTLREMLEIKDSTILLDDISVIFSSRTTQSLPAEVVTLTHTLRHARNTLRWTAPEWVRADTNIRGVTQGLVNVVPVRLPFARWVDSASDPWPRPSLVLAGLLDTSTGKADSTPTRVLRRKFVLPKSAAGYGAYDTHADTPLLGRHATEVGVCPDCGGSRVRPKHSKERHDALGLSWHAEL